MNRITQCLGFCLIGVSAPTWAEKFENSYISFHLPDGWTCQLENTEFVCRAPNPSKKNYAAIMVLTAKEPGPDDTLAAYMDHLRKAAIANGATVVKPAAQVNLEGTIWVDATLLSSEVPNYYTRYIATVKDNLAVLYTFSVHKSRYEDFAGVSTLAVQTLKVKPRTAKR